MATSQLNNANGNTVSRESVSGIEYGNVSVASTNCKKFKLPQTILPTFRGKIKEQLPFEDIIRVMVHNHEDLSNPEKLQYLKSVFKDEASQKI